MSRDSIRKPLSASAGLLLAGSALLVLNACMTDSGKDEASAIDVDKGYLFALTSDYQAAGNYSAYGIDSAFQFNLIDPVHPDAVVRYEGGDAIYVINRLGRDNMQVIDSRHLKTTLQIKFDAQSNPQDAVRKDGLIYVAFLATDKIGIYREADGGSEGSIDVSAYADESDGLAELADLQFADGVLYALTQNIDSKHGYAPLTAHLLRIDLAAGKVDRALELPFGNPAAITYDSSAARLYIPCRGEYADAAYKVNADGGIVSVDLDAFEVSDTLATEAELGGNVNPAVLHDGKLFLSLGTDAADRIIAFSIADGKAQGIVDLAPYSTGGIALDAGTETLFVGDRASGNGQLRLFDAATLEEKPDSKVDLGMAPVDLAVIR